MVSREDALVKKHQPGAIVEIIIMSSYFRAGLISQKNPHINESQKIYL